MRVVFPFQKPDAGTMDDPPSLHDGSYAAIEFEKPPRRRKKHPIGFAVPQQRTTVRGSKRR